MTIKKKIMRSISMGIMGAMLAGFSVAMAAEAWTLPETGLQMENQAKQAYVAREMGKFFHPQPGAAKPAAVKFEVPDDWSYRTFSVDGLKMEQVQNPAGKDGRVLLKLHGGGYVQGLHDRHRQMGVNQAVLTEAQSLYMVHYRLAPEHPFPAALEDAVKAYKHILAQGTKPENIMVIGDSAGGNLTLELSVYLKEHNIPKPKLLILVSPLTTLANDLPSREYNIDRDLVLGRNASPLYKSVKESTYAKGTDLKNHQLSPLYADLKGFPPMLIQAGGYELLLDDSIELMRKAAADDVDVTLTVYPGMPHEFSLMMPELDDSVASFREIRDFVSRQMR